MGQIISGLGCYFAFAILLIVGLVSGLANALGPWGTVITVAVVIIILISMNNNKPNKPLPVEKTPFDSRTVEVR